MLSLVRVLHISVVTLSNRVSGGMSGKGGGDDWREGVEGPFISG